MPTKRTRQRAFNKPKAGPTGRALKEIEALELGNKKIDELRKEINNINIQMIKFSLLGETILEWNDKDIEHYHARRMAMDSMLCRFKV